MMVPSQWCLCSAVILLSISQLLSYGSFFLSSRFCLSETSCAQEDNYPSGLCIKVNGKLFPLPVSCSRLRWFRFRKNAASNVPTKPFPPAGLRTTTKKRRRTEETWKASEHYLPRPSLLCSTQSDFSHMGAWNWKSKNTIFLWILPLFFLFFLLLVEFWNAVAETPFVLQTYSMSVYLVRQLTSPLLLQRLRMKGIRNPDHSRALSN